VKAIAKGSNSISGELYRELPSVDELLREAAIAELADREGRAMVVDAARAALEELRNGISAGQVASSAELDARVRALPRAMEETLRRAAQHSLRSLINATGVVLHTNLGRAPLSHDAIAAIERTAATYSNLEFDLAAGARGKRDVHVDRLFRRLLRASGSSEDPAKTQSPASTSTIVVNNNAAAVWLALNTLAAGGEVIVSRGELVEIGGSFRIPDVMAQSNGILREVGTTNKTRLADYERAITAKTKLLLRVHRSNFEITGFTEQPAIAELVALARARSIPLVEDLGSGALMDPASAGLRGETGVLDSLQAGVDVVTYSGDKMLGGPQAGMLSGRADLIGRMRSNSLFRALRADKLVYAALEATLLSYVRGNFDAIPALRMLRMTKEEIAERAERFATRAGSFRGLDVKTRDGESLVGAGAAPSATLPTTLVAITSAKRTPDQFLAELRANDPPIIARIEDDAVLFDLRTVFPEQEPAVLRAIERIAQD
jgi:L-seryl-tRNA(Ser) seleniumtransferase